MAFLCLLDPLGIGYLATADADEVYLTVGYELVGKLRVIHTAYAHNRDAYLALDSGYVLHVEARLQHVGRDFVNSGEAQGVTAGKVNNVDTQLGAAINKVYYLLLGHVLLHELVDGVAAHEERHGVGDVGAYFFDAVPDEPAAVFKAAAVFVGPVVGAGA